TDFPHLDQLSVLAVMASLAQITSTRSGLICLPVSLQFLIVTLAWAWAWPWADLPAGPQAVRTRAAVTATAIAMVNVLIGTIYSSDAETLVHLAETVFIPRMLAVDNGLGRRL